MESDAGTGRQGHTVPGWFALSIAILALVIATVALTATVMGRGSAGMMGGGPMMGGGSMMGGAGAVAPSNGPNPGEAGFVPGTEGAPRVIRVLAGPGMGFAPATIVVQRGETITFQVTTMGPTAHEFMVGPADAVAADKDGTPEIADIAMMQTKSLTYHFGLDGPYAFACHVPGHYEAGMRGVIAIVAP